MSTLTRPPISPDPFAAELLERGARGYAGFASSQLVTKLDGDPRPFDDWRVHLTQRILELAAALRTGVPRVFVERIRWTRQAARARDEADDQALRTALETLRETLAQELPPAAFGPAERVIDEALAIFEHAADIEPSPLDPSRTTDRLALRYLECVLEGDTRTGVDLLVAGLDDGLSIHSLYRDVLMPAQVEIGRLWHRGELGISEEHLITTTTRRAMAVLCHRAPAAAPNDRTVVATTVEGNTHDIGLRAVADFFELDGWRAVTLGTDVPAHEIATAAVYFDADLVVLSATLVVHLKALETSISTLRAARGDATKIQVGGLALNDMPELWEQLGADGFAADALEAVAVGRRLVGLDDRTPSAS